MQYFLICIGFLVIPMARAQYQVNIQVTDVPPSHKGEDIYISGNFNMWEPDEEKMKLSPNPDGSYFFLLQYTEIPGKRVEYKFTRGDWSTSESTEDGKLTGPRTIPLNKDTTIVCNIAGWRDDFPASTASENVHILDSAFYMPQLDKYRNIWIYLPEEYHSSKKKYPVIYLHDGQHLFDEATSVGRIGPIEWSVDETLDAIDEPCIIVGIDHNPDMSERIDEFYYYPNSENKEARGKAYLEFIVETLKPHVDKKYRTQPDIQNTGIGGSSMGGLISIYAGIKYPDVFGWVGVFSPSIWLDQGNIERTIENSKYIKAIAKQHYFFYAGENENRQKEDKSFVNMTEDVEKIIHLLEKNGQPNIITLINPHGRHGALYWREAFPVFYNWFIEKKKK